MIARPLGAIELDPLIAEARRRMRRRRYLAILALAGIAVAAAALTLGRGPGRSSSWRSTPSETAASAAAFRHVNWGAVTLPGSVCRGSRPIHLHRGGAIARATRPSDGLWHEWPRIYVAEIGFHPTYGMLGGRPAVGLVVGCNNGGGTADGYMAYAAVIFLARRHAAPVVAGV